MELLCIASQIRDEMNLSFVQHYDHVHCILFYLLRYLIRYRSCHWIDHFLQIIYHLQKSFLKCSIYDLYKKWKNIILLYLNSGTVYACTQRTIPVLASNSSSSDETVSLVKDDELTESTFEFEESFSDKSLNGVK